MKCLKINDKRGNASYGYLLYLMGEYKEAMKYIKKEIRIGTVNMLTYIYQGYVSKVFGFDKTTEKAL